MSESETQFDIEDEVGWMIFRPQITTLTMEEPFPANMGRATSRARDLQLQLKTPYVDFIRKDGNVVYKAVWIKEDTPMPVIQVPVPERTVRDFIPPKHE